MLAPRCRGICPVPILRLNTGPDGPVLARATGDMRAALADALAGLPADAPVVVLLHGLRYSPFRRDHDPHGHIFGLGPRPDCWKAVSWPRKLGFGRGRAEEGLCIPFAWDGALRLGAGYRRAGQAGVQLAQVLDMIATLDPARRIDLFAHSLGARVALKAMKRTSARIGRVILLTPAEFCGPARAALASPAGQGAEVIQIAPRENRVFDHLFQLTAPRRRWGDVALGLRAPKARNWVTLSISHAGHRAHLQALGFAIAPPRSRICHWSGYLRPGVFTLYRALLRQREAVPLVSVRPPVSGFQKYSDPRVF
jgi:pimeloyl-ACP methyl ester carboxylesterase